MDTVQSQHCTACGIERRVVYSEPIARGYELRFKRLKRSVETIIAGHRVMMTEHDYEILT